MKRKSSFGWVELIVGIVLLLFGVFTFFRPESMLTGIVYLYGAAAIVTGIEDIVVYVKLERFTGFGPTVSLITGIMSVMCGTMIIAYPEAVKWALSLLIPIWFIAHSVSRLAHINVVHMLASNFYYYVTLIANIAGIVLGFLMLLRPALSFMTMRVMGYIMATYLVLFGIEGIIMAFGRKDV